MSCQLFSYPGGDTWLLKWVLNGVLSTLTLIEEL